MSIWVYSYDPPGAAAYYIDNGYVYKGVSGEASYFIQENWWYSVDGGAPSFYVEGKTVYTVNGNPAYYFNSLVSSLAGEYSSGRNWRIDTKELI